MTNVLPNVDLAAVSATKTAPRNCRNDCERICGAAYEERGRRAELAVTCAGVGKDKESEGCIQQHCGERQRGKHARAVYRGAGYQAITPIARNEHDRQQRKIRSEIEQEIGHIDGMKAPQVAVLRERLRPSVLGGSADGGDHCTSLCLNKCSRSQSVALSECAKYRVRKVGGVTRNRGELWTVFAVDFAVLFALVVLDEKSAVRRLGERALQRNQRQKRKGLTTLTRVSPRIFW